MKVVVTAVQFEHRTVASFDEFAAQVEGHVRLAASYGSKLVCFPEYVTAPLLALDGGDARRPDSWERWTAPFTALMQGLARSCDLFILGGTHLAAENGRYYNTAYLFGPSGEIATQRKLHLTPCEVSPWALGVDESVAVFDTPVGRLAVLICFDIEFPEAARAAVEAGAQVLLCPSATDDRQGFCRVRYCAAARAVENHVYVLHAPLVGRLPRVPFFEQSYGRAAILSPCDVPCPPDGIVAEGEWNQDLAVTAEIDLALLERLRDSGSVTPLRARRLAYAARRLPFGRD